MKKRPVQLIRTAAVFLGAMMFLSACSPKPANTESGAAEYDFPVQIGEVTVS